MRKLSSAMSFIGVLMSLAVLTGCSPSDLTEAEPEDWVVVSFLDTNERFDSQTMDALLDYEVAADEALRSADAGWIDGNDVGDHQYDLYFNGYDRFEMWDLLKPVFDSAPVSWSRVELRQGLDDENPDVITP